MPAPIDTFVNALARVEVGPSACNQYSTRDGDVRENAIRRKNLALYLRQMEAIAPRVLLVGEAPSYRGGRLTGCAFVSETLLLAGIPTSDGMLFSELLGYRKATRSPKPSTEASATMVWGTIREVSPLPLLWNAFPFHPFHPGNPLSNRAPSKGELEIGRTFLDRLLRLFPFETIVAVGNHASTTLTAMEVAHTKVRHPSNGGKNEFVAGFRAVVG